MEINKSGSGDLKGGPLVEVTSAVCVLVLHEGLRLERRLRLRELGDARVECAQAQAKRLVDAGALAQVRRERVALLGGVCGALVGGRELRAERLDALGAANRQRLESGVQPRAFGLQPLELLVLPRGQRVHLRQYRLCADTHITYPYMYSYSYAHLSTYSYEKLYSFAEAMSYSPIRLPNVQMRRLCVVQTSTVFALQLLQLPRQLQLALLRLLEHLLLVRLVRAEHRVALVA